jgi:hypothetical protein
MKIFDSLHFRIATIFRRNQVRAEMEEELRSHIEHRADDLERSGLARDEADRRARIEFGGREKYKEEIHQALGSNFFETCLQDLRFSLRQLRKSPGFTLTAVLTLALAIGANAIVFGLMDGLVLRPLNVPQSENLYGTQFGDNPAWQSYPNYLDLRDRNRSFEDLAAFNFNLGVGFDTATHPSPTASQPPEIISTYCAFILILAASSTPLTSTAPTALRISCSPTRIGTPVFRTIETLWAVLFNSTSIPTPSLVLLRKDSRGPSCLSLPISFCPSSTRGKWAGAMDTIAAIPVASLKSLDT